MTNEDIITLIIVTTFFTRFDSFADILCFTAMTFMILLLQKWTPHGQYIAHGQFVCTD